MLIKQEIFQPIHVKFHFSARGWYHLIYRHTQWTSKDKQVGKYALYRYYGIMSLILSSSIEQLGCCLFSPIWEAWRKYLWLWCCFSMALNIVATRPQERGTCPGVNAAWCSKGCLLCECPQLDCSIHTLAWRGSDPPQLERVVACGRHRGSLASNYKVKL